MDIEFDLFGESVVWLIFVLREGGCECIGIVFVVLGVSISWIVGMGEIEVVVFDVDLV